MIATDYRAIPALVVDGVTGRLIEPGRPDQIAGAVRQIVADPDEYAAMIKAGVERCEAAFTLQRHPDAIVPLLEG